MLKDEFNKEFSQMFEMDIYFMQAKVMISEMEQIEISKARYDAGFSTMDYELSQLYPQLTKEQRAELAEEIEEEKTKTSQSLVDAVDGTEIDTMDEGANGVESDVQTEPA
jgi:CYTH domain-containing protein